MAVSLSALRTGRPLPTKKIPNQYKIYFNNKALSEIAKK
jgi:hypothetical protein